MSELLKALDVAEEVRAYLAAHLPGVQCFAGHGPTSLRSRSVGVTRTGGYRSSLVLDIATVSIDCRDLSSETGADDLARTVEALLHQGAMSGRLARVVCHDVGTLGAPYPNPDPDNPTLYRVSASYQVAVRITT